MQFESVGGIFVVLIAGVFISCIVSCIEFVWKTKKHPKEKVNYLKVNNYIYNVLRIFYMLQKSVLNECYKSLCGFKSCFKSQRIITQKYQIRSKNKKKPKQLCSNNTKPPKNEEQKEPFREFAGTEILIDSTV
jgi:hypothetical protein